MFEVILQKGPTEGSRGGPKRSKDLPYRGPLGRSTAPTIAVGLLTASDGEFVPLIAADSSPRAAGNECTEECEVK